MFYISNTAYKTLLPYGHESAGKVFINAAADLSLSQQAKPIQMEFNPVPDHKISASPKLKSIPDFFFLPLTAYSHIGNLLMFTQLNCSSQFQVFTVIFSPSSCQDIFLKLSATFRCIFLTHYQMTHFRLFQTERVCRKISNLTKMAESYPKG